MAGLSVWYLQPVWFLSIFTLLVFPETLTFHPDFFSSQARLPTGTPCLGSAEAALPACPSRFQGAPRPSAMMRGVSFTPRSQVQLGHRLFISRPASRLS